MSRVITPTRNQSESSKEDGKQAVIRPLRNDTLLAEPLRVEPAFDDPASVVEMIKRNATYKLAITLYGGDDTSYGPWFRMNWALAGRGLVEGAEPLLHNPRFVEAAKTSFRSRVVRPQGLLINLNAPMPSGSPHFDLPTFRGVEMGRAYGNWMWLLMIMGQSRLFQPWAVPVAATVSWFYRGPNGAFEYWPDGTDKPSKSERSPLWNVGVVSDNDYMFHRVGAVGDPKDYLAPGKLTPQSLLHLTEDGNWEIRDGRQVIARYGFEQIRVSILWKAEIFVDEKMAAIRDDHSDDLDQERIVHIFSEDLRRRGIKFREPTDIVNDDEWKQTLLAAYPCSSLAPSTPEPGTARH